jgi:hypothetical protein
LGKTKEGDVTEGTRPTDFSFSPSLRLKPPGPLGLKDAASPDNRLIPPKTPGPLGVNDVWSHDTPQGSYDSRRKLCVDRLTSGVKELERSRNEIMDTYVHGTNLSLLSGGRLGDEELAGIDQKVETHDKIAVAYFSLLKTYLEEFYDPTRDPDDTVTTFFRISGLSRDDVLRQKMGYTTHQSETERMVSELTVQLCTKTFESYQTNKSAEEFIYVMLLVREIQINSNSELYEEIPSDLRSMIEGMALEKAKKVSSRSPEETWKDYVELLIKGIRPGDTMWDIVHAKAAAKVAADINADPIRTDFERWKNTK